MESGIIDKNIFLTLDLDEETALLIDKGKENIDIVHNREYVGIKREYSPRASTLIVLDIIILSKNPSNFDIKPPVNKIKVLIINLLFFNLLIIIINMFF